MLGLGLRQLQEVLNHKADEIQHEFTRLGEQVEVVNAKLLEAEGEARKPLLGQQRSLRQQQAAIAEEINLWRERARGVTQTAGQVSLRALLEELGQAEDETIRLAVGRTLQILDDPEGAMEARELERRPDQIQTPAGRLLDRGRTEYDLRLSNAAGRMRAAAEFANRPGIAQDDAALSEVEAALEDPDPLVRELAVATVIHIHRYRAMRLADLDGSHEAVQALSRMQVPQAVAALAEVLRTQRTGYVPDENGELQEMSNTRSRMVALLRLVEWHTAEARVAVESVRFDKETEIAKAASHALEVFPEPWSGPLKRAPEA